MATKSTPPSVTATAFDCPHCGAFTTQHWFQLLANVITDGQRTPSIPDEDTIRQFQSSKELSVEEKTALVTWAKETQTGLVLLDKHQRGTSAYVDVSNLFLSECYNCKKVAVWVHDRLVFPALRVGQEPNQDLPPDIIRDFEEARSILDLSPRGAAALLRLAVQKLCGFLGEPGKNINDDIGSLVSKGLNPVVHQSLDVVRVVGNEAVHPGLLDLKDDRDTAIRLLGLVNLIADQMITHPKSAQAMYEQLPEKKRQEIEARNARALGTNKK
jgi:hypothetical protein